MGKIRERTLFIGILALLAAIWILKTALHMAGAAIRIIIIVGVIFLALAWVSSKVGSAGRR
ncbi:MAG TPA: hypothetical protein VF980_06055 [Thermoanaerobaculia bacterium]